LVTDSCDVLVSMHPRLKDKLHLCTPGWMKDKIKLLEPFTFTQWVRLESCARCVITDSGSEPEEAAVLGTPSVMLRDSTERGELIEHGCSMLSGCSNVNAIVRCVRTMEARINESRIVPPPDYARSHVAEAIVQIVLAQAPLDSSLGGALDNAHA
jgi:UDP-N-acetylglucosamine 2-epimerase (non-hydrolysing)